MQTRINPLLVVVGLLLLAACAPPASPAAPTAAPAAPPAASAPPATATPVLPAPTPVPPTAAPTAGAIKFADIKPQVDAVMSGFMKQNDVAGCSVALAFPDPATGKLQTPMLNYGTLSKTSKTPVDSMTEYEIASLTKLFTSDLLALDVGSGLMQLDDPLQKYLPPNVHVPAFNGQPITLRNLATHTAGLPRKPDNVPQERTVNGAATWGYVSVDEMYGFLNAFKLTRAPGSRWEYSNVGFSLLGMAEEKAGGAAYETLVLQKIIAPLGLRNTRIVLTPAEKAKLAQGYAADGSPAAPVAVGGVALSAGALRSTIQDLAAYLAANIDPRQTKLAPALQMTQQPQGIGPAQNSAAALGWNILAPGTPAEQLSKDGQTAGYNSYIAFTPSRRDGFVVICNGHNVSSVAAVQLHKLFGEFILQLDDNPQP